MLKVVEKYTKYKYKFNIYLIVLQKTYILEFVCVFQYYFLLSLVPWIYKMSTIVTIYFI